MKIAWAEQEGLIKLYSVLVNSNHAQACLVLHTSYSSLPDGVGVFEAWHDVVGDSEGETEAIEAAILECKCIALIVCLEWDW